METLLVKIFATALALSQVATTPDSVKTQFDRAQDQQQVAKLLRWLEDLDDVQNVYSNADLGEDAYA